ncbi:MAG TPA: glycoside hydrolase family 2 TIM barrel-domain containing protein [Opitutaceae bacterium]|nr:glycoside hydrolase family 2 TIM barrel-domain containing protein [Opitutaceae bacterium]
MLPPLLLRLFRLLALGAGLGLALVASAQPVTVAPVREGPWSRSLNGSWQFKYLAGSDVGADANFFAPSFDAAAWKSIPVPSHWELQGFAEPKYGKLLEAGLGLYRTKFRVARDWAGRRVFVLFDGVLYGFDAWINGVKVGSWASGYNPVTFDITDALRQDGDNVLAVQVTTRSKGWEFDTNDCWSLSGIYRGVTLFSTPVTHFQDYTARTTLAPDGSADVQLEVQAERASGSPAASVNGRLLSPAGRTVREFQLALADDGRGETALKVAQPELWTAETPSLYRLELDLVAGGKVVQQVREKIGLRQVTIEGGVLKLNGRPVKLRGADHHDIFPDVGRALTEELMWKDLALIKAANMNFIRTSHYPSHPRFIELCDELGIYVLCEVPFGFGDEHLTDPTYQDSLLTRARATVGRDKNRASIIAWSVGNENPNTPLTFATGREVKRLDPTRPICFPQVGSYFGRTYNELPEFVDMYSPHYPVASTLRDYAQRLKRPILVTEYAHALGLASDRIQEEWDIMQKNERFAGGAVWMFQDQGILRTSPTPLEANTPSHYVWLHSRHYYDTSDMDGVDGIVYSDRTPQVDYWEVRKVYSPVQIAKSGEEPQGNRRTVSLDIENRYDFRSLAGITLNWSYQVNGKDRQTGRLPLHATSHGRETVALSLEAPPAAAGSVRALQLRCVDEAGQQFYERTFRLESGTGALIPELVAAQAPREPAATLSEDNGEIRIARASYEIRANRQTGAVTLRDPAGRVLVAGIYPHVGRKYTMAEELRAKPNPLALWKGSFLPTISEPKVEAERTADGVKLTVRGRYARPDAPDQSLDGEYSLLVTDRGEIDVAYNYVPTKATGAFLEAGLSLVVPQASEFRWIGQGPYPAYPGKDALDEYGIHHLNREDLNFQGNRRQVEAAVLSDAAGVGVVLGGDQLDIAVENSGPDTVVLSQNALISGRGNKGSGPEVSVNSGSVKQISGKFELLPAKAAWPQLETWFGRPNQRVAVLHPFFQSYDQ